MVLARVLFQLEVEVEIEDILELPETHTEPLPYHIPYIISYMGTLTIDWLTLFTLLLSSQWPILVAPLIQLLYILLPQLQEEVLFLYLLLHLVWYILDLLLSKCEVMEPKLQLLSWDLILL